MKTSFFCQKLSLLFLLGFLSTQILQAQNSEFCPCNYFSNGDFEIGTPTNANNSISLALGWDAIWNGSNQAEFYDSTHSQGGFPIPAPASGNYASHWIDNYNRSNTSVWREGMQNKLVEALPLNSGQYSLSFDMACLDGSGTAEVAIYAISAPNGYVYAPAPTSSHSPLNLDLFQSIPGQEIAFLGAIEVPNNCDGTKQSFNLQLDTDSLPLPTDITHIMITKSDALLPSSKYVAFDNFCLPVCSEVDFGPLKPAINDLFPLNVQLELGNGTDNMIDKEYGDIDNDGDIDILYTKNGKLHVLINNAGAGNPPNYTIPGNEIILNYPAIPAHPYFPAAEISAISYRLYDWDNDGINDLIVLAGKGGDNQSVAGGIFLFMNDGNGDFPNAPILLLDSMDHGDQYGYHINNEFPAEFDQFIEVGDLNNDGLPDLLISGKMRINGIAYFENNGTSFDLVAPQVMAFPTSGSYLYDWITNLFIPEDSGSLKIPELFSNDCTSTLDLFVSDPLWYDAGTNEYGGGRTYFHSNGGAVTNGVMPDIDPIGIIDQFGLNDDPSSNYPNPDFPTYSESPLRCDWVVTRFVDYFGTGCPIAILFNFCSQKFYYYEQDCSCTLEEMGIDDEITPMETFAPIIFPNPAKDNITIKMNGRSNQHEFAYQIYDLTGRTVKNGKGNFENPLQVQNLNPGNYVIKLSVSGKTHSLKFIKL